MGCEMKFRPNRLGSIMVFLLIGLLVLVVLIGVFMMKRMWRNASPTECSTEIVNVSVDFGSMVREREYVIGLETGSLKASMNLYEMYMCNNELVLSFRGAVTCLHGTGECFINLCAGLFINGNLLCIKPFRLGKFYSQELTLGDDREYIATTLFLLLEKELNFHPFDLRVHPVSLHRINNNFIELKIKKERR